MCFRYLLIPSESSSISELRFSSLEGSGKYHVLVLTDSSPQFGSIDNF